MISLTSPSIVRSSRASSVSSNFTFARYAWSTFNSITKVDLSLTHFVKCFYALLKVIEVSDPARREYIFSMLDIEFASRLS